MSNKNYVLGKGKLYFLPFVTGTRGPAPGVGFGYFGNTPSLETSRTATALDHYDADNGIKVKDDSIDIETGITGKFACDNISSQNLALWFAGTVNTINQTSGSAVTETIMGGLPDNFYQIGQTPSNPAGIRNVTGFAATLGTGTPTALVAGVDYVFTPATGLFYVIPGGAVQTSGGTINLTYTLATAVQDVVIEQGTQVVGSLKFIATNPKGPLRDYLYPFVKLTAEGAFALKGDAWQQMSWNFEALQLNDTTRRVYITSR